MVIFDEDGDVGDPAESGNGDNSDNSTDYGGDGLGDGADDGISDGESNSAGNEGEGDGIGDCGRRGARAITAPGDAPSPKCQCTDMQIFCKWCAKKQLLFFSISLNIIPMIITKIH